MTRLVAGALAFAWMVCLSLNGCTPSQCPTPDLPSLEGTLIAGVRATLTAETPLPSPTATHTGTPSPTVTPSPTPTPIPEPSSTATATRRPSPTSANLKGVAATATLPVGATETPAPDITLASDPHVLVENTMNVRAGPGTLYAILGQARPGEAYQVTGRNTDGSWWQIVFGGVAGWVLADLVSAVGVDRVGIAEEIPTLPAPTPVVAEEIEEEGAPADPCAYVGNKNSLKFHIADCQWVAKMNPENKICFASRQEALAQGYEPCKVCNP